MWNQRYQILISKTLIKRKFGYIGQILRRPPEAISSQAPDWNRQSGKKIEKTEKHLALDEGEGDPAGSKDQEW